jgi:CRISPR-associated protein Csm2
MDIDGKNYCEKAESAVKSLGRPDNRDPQKLRFDFTTSKIRNLLSQVNEIYNDVIFREGDALDDRFTSRISYLRVRMVYEAGREPSVKAFLDKSGLLKYLREIDGSKKNFLLFCRYFEALVAYHRFLGGAD